jgi:hypothetical protein
MSVAWSMADNATFEQSCYEQAKSEVDGSQMTGIDYLRAVLKRAQEIKAEKRAEL